MGGINKSYSILLVVLLFSVHTCVVYSQITCTTTSTINVNQGQAFTVNWQQSLAGNIYIYLYRTPGDIFVGSGPWHDAYHNSGSQSAQITTTSETLGPHKIKICTAENNCATCTGQVQVNYAISFSAPASGATIRQAESFTITYSKSPSWLVIIQLKDTTNTNVIHTLSGGTSSSSNSYSIPASVNPGNYLIFIKYVEDGTQSATRSITLSDTPSSLTIVYPTNNQAFERGHGALSIYWDSAPSYCGAIFYSFDGAAASVLTNDGSHGGPNIGCSYATGTHTISIKAASMDTIQSSVSFTVNAATTKISVNAVSNVVQGNSVSLGWSFVGCISISSGTTTVSLYDSSNNFVSTIANAISYSTTQTSWNVPNDRNGGHKIGVSHSSTGTIFYSNVFTINEPAAPVDPPVAPAGNCEYTPLKLMYLKGDTVEFDFNATFNVPVQITVRLRYDSPYYPEDEINTILDTFSSSDPQPFHISWVVPETAHDNEYAKYWYFQVTTSPYIAIDTPGRFAITKQVFEIVYPKETDYVNNLEGFNIIYFVRCPSYTDDLTIRLYGPPGFAYKYFTIQSYDYECNSNAVLNIPRSITKHWIASNNSSPNTMYNIKTQFSTGDADWQLTESTYFNLIHNPVPSLQITAPTACEQSCYWPSSHYSVGWNYENMNSNSKLNITVRKANPETYIYSILVDVGEKNFTLPINIEQYANLEAGIYFVNITSVVDSDVTASIVVYYTQPPQQPAEPPSTPVAPNSGPTDSTGEGFKISAPLLEQCMLLLSILLFSVWTIIN